MQHEVLIAVMAGLGGMFGWGLADLFAKKTIDSIGDVASLAWGHIFGTIVLLSVVLYYWIVKGQPMAVPQDLGTWIFLIIFGIAQAIVYFFVYNGFGKGQVAVLNPVFASFSGIAALFSIFIFREVVSPYLLVGLVVLFLGIILISTDFQALRSKRLSYSHIPGFKEVALATLLAAMWTLFWDRFVSGEDWLSFTLLMYAFMTVFILILARARRVKLGVKDRSIWKFLVLIGLCETVAYLAISVGYSRTSLTSIVALLSGAFSLPTIIFARMFLKERITRLQTIGSLVIILAVVLIAVL